MSTSQWDCRLRNSSAHYRKTRQFLKAEKIQRNSCIFTGQQRILFAFSTLILDACKALSVLTKATASRAPRIHDMSNTGAQRNHWDELKNSTDGLTERETLKRSVSVPRVNILAKLILSLQLTHWRIQSENVLAIGQY